MEVLVPLFLKILVLSLLPLGFSCFCQSREHRQRGEWNVPGVPGSPATFSVVGTEVSLVFMSADKKEKERWRNSLGRSLILDVVLLGVRHGDYGDEREVKGTLEVGLF